MTVREDVTRSLDRYRDAVAARVRASEWLDRQRTNGKATSPAVRDLEACQADEADARRDVETAMLLAASALLGDQ